MPYVPYVYMYIMKSLFDVFVILCVWPGRFHVTYSLTQPPVGWKGAVGNAKIMTRKAKIMTRNSMYRGNGIT
jgi:hypothetical protein